MKDFAQRSVSSLLLCASQRSSTGGEQVSLADFLDRRSAAASKPNCLREEEKPQIDSLSSTSLDRACDSLKLHRLSRKRSRSSLQDQGYGPTKAVRQHQGNCCRSPHLLVMGDVPMRRSRTRKPDFYQSHGYNHYADGCGWWGEGMLGMEEAGTPCKWEGLASMSLGTTAPASPLFDF